MRKKRSQRSGGFSLQQFTASTEARLVVGFFVLLYGVGGGLIWLFFGLRGALLGDRTLDTSGEGG